MVIMQIKLYNLILIMEEKMKKIVLLAVITIFSSGCVKKSVYETTAADLNKTKEELSRSKEDGLSLKEALAKEQEKVTELEDQIEELKNSLLEKENQLRDRDDELLKLNDKLTETIKDKSKLKESAAKLKRALAELERRKAAADKRVREFKNLLKKFKKLIDAGKLKVAIKEGRMVLVLPTDILFASGSAKLSDDGKAAVVEVAAVLKTIRKRRFQVEGHTDNDPILNKRTYKNNWELAAGRAMGVLQAMIDAGMNPKMLSAASYGEFHPVATNKTKNGKAANRRIDIVIVPDLSDLPGFAELKKVVDGK
jgi:chemotaxis protein MotB